MRAVPATRLTPRRSGTGRSPRIIRTLERPHAAADMLAGFWKDEEQPLAQVQLAGRVLLGDGSDSTVAAERMETVRAEVEQLDNSTRERYEQATAELDRALRDDALAWDEGVLRRQVNEPLVERLNRSNSA